MRIFKFGGASVKDAAAVENVKDILSLYPQDNLVIVVSAMGKTTNAMEQITDALYHKDFETFRNLVLERKAFHFSILEDLFKEKSHLIFNEVLTIFNDLGNRVNIPISENYDFEYDQIVSLGEVVSTKIIEAYLSLNSNETVWSFFK